MKFCMVFISLLLGTTVFAETIDINWYKDNQLYQTTTCEIGNDVLLPTAPTKRGHIFKGWMAKHVNRGTFENWSFVPSNINNYLVDGNGNKTPLINDYIIVEDASAKASINAEYSYALKLNIPPNKRWGSTVWYSYDGGITKQLLDPDQTYQTIHIKDPNDDTITIIDVVIGGQISVISRKPVNINGVLYDANTTLKTWAVTTADSNSWYDTILYTKDTLSGTWKFVYNGIWAVDGKKGWVPQEQIANE